MSSQIKLNNAIEFPPMGCIIAYMGTVAPEGWILCDGKEVNNSDGRYNNLIAAKIGTGNANGKYTPPSLIGKFLRGADTATNVGFDTTNKLFGGGSNTATLTTNNLPIHKHDVTDPGHIHGVDDKGHSHTATTKRNWNRGDYHVPYSSWTGDWFSGRTVNVSDKDRPAPTLNFKTEIKSNTTGITISHATPSKMSSQSSGISTPFTIIPSYINVNYIIKF